MHGNCISKTDLIFVSNLGLTKINPRLCYTDCYTINDTNCAI